ncbi:MAG: peptide MFS transporter, partial [Gammaproteobacteria bacterium]
MSEEGTQDLEPEVRVPAAGDSEVTGQGRDSGARHPKKAFVVLAFIEVWERFGYYGMTALMVLYMVEHLGLGDARADTIWGAFSALVYCMPMLGGYIGDRVLGARRTLVLGAIGLGLGYILLSIPMRATFFPAMGLLVLGNGLFKVNPNSLVSRLYEGDRSKLDILFTLYYVSLNIGSFVSILLAPWIKNHTGWMIVLGPLRFDSWHLAFGISAIGMTIALLDFGVFHRFLRPYGTIPDFKKLDLRKLFAVIGAGLIIAWLMSEIIRNHAVALAIVGLFLVLMIAVFAHLLITGEKRDRNRVIACIAFTLMSVVWAIYNQQIYTSLTLFALRNVQ